MSNYYKSKCCDAEVTPFTGWIEHDGIGHPGGRNWYECHKCKKECEVIAMLDKPNGVPESSYIGGVNFDPDIKSMTKTEQNWEEEFDRLECPLEVEDHSDCECCLDDDRSKESIKIFIRQKLEEQKHMNCRICKKKSKTIYCSKECKQIYRNERQIENWKKLNTKNKNK